MSTAPDGAADLQDDIVGPSDVDLEVRRFVQDLRLIGDPQPTGAPDDTPRRSHLSERPSK